MLLMSDILPTGYSVAVNARMLMEVPPIPSLLGSSGLSSLAEGKVEKKGVCVVIGCGPVSCPTSRKMLGPNVCLPGRLMRNHVRPDHVRQSIRDRPLPSPLGIRQATRRDRSTTGRATLRVGQRIRWAGSRGHSRGRRSASCDRDGHGTRQTDGDHKQLWSAWQGHTDGRGDAI